MLKLRRAPEDSSMYKELNISKTNGCQIREGIRNEI